METGSKFFSDHKDYEHAADCFTVAISAASTNKEFYNAYSSRGLMYTFLNNPYQAIEDYRKALSYSNGSEKTLEKIIKYLKDAEINNTFQEPYSSPYVLGAYDFIDNGAGDLMLIMEPPEGDAQAVLTASAINSSRTTTEGSHADDDAAKFIFDGTLEGMLIRNNEQTVYLPILQEAVREMLQKLKYVLVVEKKDYDVNVVINSIKTKKMPENYFTAIYTAEIEIINSPLPIPQQDYNYMRGKLRCNKRRAARLPLL